jgi:4'-phosphopantetheinyl transferase
VSAASTAGGLVPGAVDVWQADLQLAGEHERELRETLSTDERERARRFVDADDGVRWARARGILRVLLGGYLGADPLALRFALGEQGKPALAADAIAAAADVRFNLSHSGDVALYAFALGLDVGVDVELARRRLGDVVRLAGRELGADAASRLRALEPRAREREFLRLWTRHEAVVKCSGVGIGAGSAAHGKPVTEPWVVELDVGADGAAALAVAGPPREVRRLRWE